MKRILLSLMCVSIILLASCAVPGNPRGATLVIRLAAHGSLVDPAARSASRVILPQNGVAVLKWSISGSGPYGDSLEIVDSENTVNEIPRLSPGEWTLTAEGKDKDGVVIVKSEPTKVTLGSAGTTSLTLSCGPLAGTGTFTFGLTLPTGFAVTPKVSVVLAPLGAGTADPISVTAPVLDEATGTWNASASPQAGWYVLSIRIIDDGADPANNLVWAFADTLRILMDRDTPYTRTVTAAEVAKADNSTIGITATSTLTSGMALTLASPESRVSTIGGMAFTANTVAPGTIFWCWYLDGTLIAGAETSTWTVPAGLQLGSRHWITVTAYRKADGINVESAGSATADFTVAG